MDLETRNINNINSPYCISIYDGKNCNSFYLTNYPNERIMLITAINFVMKRKFNQYKIFFHNFSYFDSVFLLHILSDLSNDIKPIINHGNFIDLKFITMNHGVINFL
jgi:hypothetical protein